MSWGWWQTLLIGGGSGAGGAGLLVKLFRNRRLRKMASDALNPDPSPSAIDELRLILDEQRRGYDHLAGRVTNLENTIASLETKLAEERAVAKNLRRQLREERKVSGARISILEKQLGEARARIAHLEDLLEQQGGPDGQAPGVEVPS